jgi:phospholipase/carboxylesterase
MSASSLHYIVHKAPDTSAAQGAPMLLLLHGYGSNEEDLIGLAPHLDSRLFCASARAPYSLDFGGYAWFNIERGPEGVSFDFAEAVESLGQVFALVDALVAEHRSERVFIAGFSQGASMALSAALKRPASFAGVAALSGVCSPEMLPDDPETVRGLKVLMTHGRQDPLIPIAQARASKALLDPLELDLTYNEYDMPHAIDQACLEDIDAWLKARLNEH